MSSLITKGNASGTGSVTLESPNTNSDFTISLPATTGTVVLTGTTPTLNGITFPATQVPSADANTLDDYEEGTWTPTITAGFSSPTYGNQVGTYTKIGNVVTFSLRIDLGSSTRTGSILTFTLPFTSRNMGHNPGGASWNYVSSGVVNSVSTNLPTLYVNANTAEIVCYKTDGVAFFGTDLSNAAPSFYLSGSYLTA